MRLYKLIMFLCMLFLSCKEAMFFEGSGVAVNKISSVTKIDDLFCDFELLPLSVGDSGAFRNADKLVFHKNNYYIMDKSGRRQVLVFDENGNCQRAIGQPGKGRGEYTHIEDFAID